MPAKLTWKEVDAIVQMTKDGKPFSLSELEKAIATDDTSSVKAIVAGLQGKDPKYKAKVFPFGGIKLIPDAVAKRCHRWFEEDALIDNVHSQAVSRRDKMKRELDAEEEAEKEKKKSAATAEELEKTKKELAREKAKSAAERAKEEAEAKRKAKAKKESTIPLKKRIKFDKLNSDASKSAYVPAEDALYEFPQYSPEFATMLDNGMNIWLYGLTGSGKSSLAEQCCFLGELPLIYQSFHEDIKPDSLFGGFRLEDGNTIWQDGPVTKAYREGFVLLLDEVDGCPPEILFSLFGILDRKPLILADNGSEVVKPHPDFRVVATGNTQGRGDETGAYAGTNMLNKAFLNRFRIWYKVDYPSEETYRRIIMSEGVTAAVAKDIAKLAREINTAAANNVLTETFSLRDAREIARTAEILAGDVKRALELTVMNRLSKIEKSALASVLNKMGLG